MVIYFSGNGNSEAIAVALSHELKTDAINLRGKNLIYPTRCNLEIKPGEPVVWIFPVYSWGIPPVIDNFISNCDLDFKNSEHYLVLTCGDDCGLAAKQWEKRIEKRGGNPKGKISVFMPNTYVLMKGFDVDTKETADKKIKNALDSVINIAGLISSGFTDDKTYHGKFAWIKSKIIYPWFIRFAMSPKPFHVDDTCISCGKCARSCPLDNILMVKDKNCRETPQWSNNCALCLSDYSHCS